MPDNGQISGPCQISDGPRIHETIQTNNWTIRGTAPAVSSAYSKRLGVPIYASLLLITAVCSTLASAQEFESVRVTNGLYYPVGAEAAPGTVNRLYVHEQRGIIKIVDTLNETSGTFMNIDSKVGSFTGEGGLLGLAFHPDFANNRMFFVNYTNNSGNTVIARYTANNDDSASASSEEILMTVSQPYSNHNAGWLEFSPVDGHLYISMGDGGSGGDPGNRSQKHQHQARQDPSDQRRQSNRIHRPLRQPRLWASMVTTRFGATGFEMHGSAVLTGLNGAMVMADVGQNAWEEVNYEPAGEGGRNYGWRCYEGNNGYNTSGCPSQSSLSFPVHTYSHSSGISITGGRVYQGLASLYGRYFFADYASNQIWSINPEGGSLEQPHLSVLTRRRRYCSDLRLR